MRNRCTHKYSSLFVEISEAHKKIFAELHSIFFYNSCKKNLYETFIDYIFKL